MNKKLLSRLAPGLFAVVLFTACRPAATVKGNLDVIPQPQEIVLARDTTPFIIDRSTTIVYPARGRAFVAAQLHPSNYRRYST